MERGIPLHRLGVTFCDLAEEGDGNAADLKSFMNQDNCQLTMMFLFIPGQDDLRVPAPDRRPRRLLRRRRSRPIRLRPPRLGVFRQPVEE